MERRNLPVGLAVALAVVTAMGLPAVVDLLANGHANTGCGPIVPWGLWVAAYVFFVGASVGAFLVSTLSPVFGILRFRPLVPLSLLVVLVSLGTGLFFIAADVGRPERIVFMLTHPRLTSVMPWLNGLYMIYGALVTAELWFALRPSWALAGGFLRHLSAGYRSSPEQTSRDERWLRVLGNVGLLLALMIECAVGALFAVVRGRPIWNTGLLPITFVLSALCSGGALVLLLSLLFSRGGGAYRRTVLALGRLVGTLLAIDLVVMLLESLVVVKSRIPSQIAVLETIALGPYAWVFWGVHLAAGTILPLLLLLPPRRTLGGVAAGCLLVLAGGFAFRLNTVIPQLAVPAFASLPEAVADPGLRATYFPTLMEWGVLAFGVGAAGLAFLASLNVLRVVRRHQAVEFELLSQEAVVEPLAASVAEGR